MTTKVAVLLAGCGVNDGSEIHEVVLTLLALDEAGVEVECFAPDGDQAHVVNHLTHQPVAGEKRNVLIESARIARGKVRSLKEASATDFDALILPGGFGVAKNLCNYTTEGREADVDTEVSRVVKEFVAAEKPIGAMCIAPIVVAAVFKGDDKVHPMMTIGSDPSTAADLESFGATHLTCGVKDCVSDVRNRIVTTPAYMLGQGPAEVREGITKMVHAVLEMASAW